MFKQAPRIIKLCIIGVFIVCIVAFLFFRALKPSSELSEDKFVEVYVQLSIAHETLASDTLKWIEEKKRIFEQNGILSEDVDRFISRHNQKPEGWGMVWKKIAEKLSEEFVRQKEKGE